MIKLFHKIRQNLLVENKTGKYFKYVIDEIALIIIGTKERAIELNYC
jgi:hypothetical protein